MAICKQCKEEYSGPAVDHILYSQYCQNCKRCPGCADAIDVKALEFNLKYKVETPWLCNNCQSTEYRETIESRRIPITAKELDWMNRVRLMIEVNMDCSIDTNMRSAELGAEGWIHDMPMENAYIFLKRMEAITATVSVALKKVKKEIQLDLEGKERQKYQSAATTSKRTQLEQCVHCKLRFPLDKLETHKLKCKTDLSPTERIKAKQREKAAEGYRNLGLSEEQIEETLKETFDKIRGEVKR